MAQANHNIRLIGFLAFILGYSLLANYTLQSKQHTSIGALIAIAPSFFTCFFLALQSKRRMLMLSLLALSTPFFWLAWDYIKLHYDWVYWLMHESLQLLLLFTFARTLAPGKVPLCTQFATLVHGSLSTQHAAYARKVTIAWALFFAVILIVSNWLFFFYPVSTWSRFVNFGYLPLVTTMFIAEYMVRKQALPKEHQADIMEAVHAFINNRRG